MNCRRIIPQYRDGVANAGAHLLKGIFPSQIDGAWSDFALDVFDKIALQRGPNQDASDVIETGEDARNYVGKPVGGPDLIRSAGGW